LFAFLFSIHIAHIAHVGLVGVIFHEICLRGVNMESAPLEIIMKKKKLKDGFKFKAGDGFRLTFERIEQAKAAGCADPQAIAAYLVQDKVLNEGMGRLFPDYRSGGKEICAEDGLEGKRPHRRTGERNPRPAHVCLV
jgi:hypothetical protein